MPGPFELIIILAIVLLLFGGKRLKNIGGDLGNAIKGFKTSMKDNESEIDKADQTGQINNQDDVIEAKVVKEDKKQEK
ncbi:Twin-arginine translocation protein TatA [hydrothermal vent metagenome]|uniref:Twin-arginine translocation protein TatA n=1 Tax=hydrothermal vent metagenome TaxID=652676 RepID=A0A1W1E6K7_9ZZZZ